MKISYKDLFEDWEEVTEDRIWQKMVDSQNWGKILEYLIDCCKDSEFYDTIINIMEYIIEEIKNKKIKDKEIIDVVSVAERELSNFLDKALVSKKYLDAREMVYYIPIIGLLKKNKTITLLKRFTNLEFFVERDRAERFECELYYFYRKEALKALWEIGGNKFIKIYAERLKDSHIEVVQIALELISKIKIIKSKKIMKSFYYNPLDYYYNYFELKLDLNLEIHNEIIEKEKVGKIIDIILFVRNKYFFESLYYEDCTKYLEENQNSLIDFYKEFLEKIEFYNLYNKILRIPDLLVKSDKEEKIFEFLKILEMRKDNKQIQKQILLIRNI